MFTIANILANAQPGSAAIFAHGLQAYGAPGNLKGPGLKASGASEAWLILSNAD